MARRKANRRTTSLGTVYKDHDSWYAKYWRCGTLHRAGCGFSTYQLADQWLASEQRLIDLDTWTPPAERRATAEKNATTLGQFAAEWIDNRTTPTGGPLSGRTKLEYGRYLSGRLAPLAELPLVDITRERVDQWWADNEDAFGMRKNCYQLLKTLMRSAEDRELIVKSPCRVAYASRRKPSRSRAERDALIVSMTPETITDLAEHMDPRWRALIVLLAYTGLRVGEALALTRADVTCEEGNGLPRWTVRVRRTVSKDADGMTVGDTKTLDSRRIVPVPPHVTEVLSEHMAAMVGQAPSSPMFPAVPRGPRHAKEQAMLGTPAKYRTGKDAVGRADTWRPATGFHAAKEAVGRPDLHVHDLRRVARYLWTKAGMGDYDAEQLLGHSLPLVQAAYKVHDIATLWPAMDRVSQLAGWNPPTHDAPDPSPALPTMVPEPASTVEAPAISPKLLNRMTPARLVATLDAMSDDELDRVVPHLLPDQLAAALTYTPESEEDNSYGARP
ncbi:MAG: site-specific integrase [Cutibacterium avidum]|nr:site-specific integrase [Cutibacterium avidum]